MRVLRPGAGEQLTGVLEAGASQRCYLPDFSGSATPPWSLNREFFCLQMFSLFYFYKETRQICSFPVTFFVFNSSFGSGGRYRLERNGGLRAKASVKVAGLQVPEMWRFVLCT